MTEWESRLRAALAQERAAAAGRLASSEAGVADLVAAADGSNVDDEHDPEGQTLAFERSQLGALGEAARTRLREVAAAEARLAAGTYGTCERCGGAVAPERLLARPTARTCVRCAAAGASR